MSGIELLSQFKRDENKNLEKSQAPFAVSVDSEKVDHCSKANNSAGQSAPEQTIVERRSEKSIPSISAKSGKQEKESEQPMDYLARKLQLCRKQFSMATQSQNLLASGNNVVDVLFNGPSDFKV
ncbi:unnamed protein product [Gongylonema pulchrum]|uniref:Ovule protein n=1 Tax=Gongylonema pulchrum TaxID=637853 RepID=A0A183DCY0_9BILA|nr:unnamed protein product [Gongylonema pulchrum]